MNSHPSKPFHSASLVPWLSALRRALVAAFGPQYRGFFLSRNQFLDKKGMDGVLILAGGRRFAVDVKCPSRNPPSRAGKWALALETWGCKERGDRGYLLSGGKITRYVLWLYPNENWLLLPFRSLAAVVRNYRGEWGQAYGRRSQQTKGFYESYHSECIVVPTVVVAAAVTDRVRQHHPRFQVRSSLQIR